MFIANNAVFQIQLVTTIEYFEFLEIHKWLIYQLSASSIREIIFFLSSSKY